MRQGIRLTMLFLGLAFWLGSAGASLAAGSATLPSKPGSASMLPPEPAPEPEEIPATVLFSMQVKDKDGGVFEEPVELLSWADGSFSYPIKYIAGLMENDPQNMPASGAITFNDKASNQFVVIDANHQKIQVGSQNIVPSRHPLKSSKSGYISPEDVYVDQATMEKLLDIKLATASGDQTVVLKTTRTLKAVLRKGPGAADDEDAQQGGIAANGSIPLILPDEPRNSLSKMSFDFTSTRYQQRQFTPVFGSNASQNIQWVDTGASLRTGFSGYLFGMPYTIAPRWGLMSGQTRMTDLQWSIAKTLKNGNEAKLGSLNIAMSSLVAPNASVWGLQWASRNARDSIIKPVLRKTVQGSTLNAEPVSLEVNGSVRSVQAPVAVANGDQQEYRFDSVELELQQPQTIRVLQGREVLQEVSVPGRQGALLQQGEKAFSSFTGHAAPIFQNTGTDWLLPHSNKWLAGSRAYYGLTDRLTVGIATATDRIFGEARTSPLSLVLSQIATPDLSGYTSFRRDPNLVSGGNAGISVVYRPALMGAGSHWLLSGEASASRMRNHSPENGDDVLSGSGVNPNAPNLMGRQSGLLSTNPQYGLAGQISADYSLNNSSAQVKLFHYGTNFYTPTTNINSTLYDRQGLSFSGRTALAGFTVQGKVERYNTNLSGFLDGGVVAVTHWDTALARALGKYASFRLSSSRLLGRNAERSLASSNNEADLNLTLPFQFQAQMAYIRSNTQSVLNPNNPLQTIDIPNQSIVNHTLRTTFQGPLPKNAGFIQAGLSLSPLLNLANLSLNCHWKKLYIEPALQMSLMSDNQLAVMALGLYYQQDNGQRVGVRYTYSNASNGLGALYGIGVNGLRTQQATHQFQLDLGGTLALLHNRLTSSHREESGAGTLDGMVFMDLNRNGRYDKNEPGVAGVTVLADQTTQLTSGKNGRVSKTGLLPGTYRVGLEMEKLPIGLTPTTTAVNAVIAKGRRTRVELGVICTPGQLSGIVTRKDARQAVLSPADIMVSLLGPDGKPIQYTYTDETGHYTLNNVPPGKFQVQIDQRQIDSSRYEVLTRPYIVEVPVVINQAYTHENMDFELFQLFEK